VRIRLDRQQLTAHPLRIGLSTRVRVDLRPQGLQLAAAPRSAPAYETSVYAADAVAADALIGEIVAINKNGKAARNRHSQALGMAARP
jgi:membrane fusion protein (multidrug efflux system)